MSALFSGATAPFAAALLLVLVIAAAEAVGFVVGASASSALDHAVGDLAHDPGADGDVEGGFLSWLGLGRVPLLVWLVIFLSAFGLSGFVVQHAAASVFGKALPAALAALGALATALPATGLVARAIARILPNTETEAVSIDGFVGRVAVVVRGTARAGLAAEARVKDERGRTHHVRVEPDDAGETLEEGAEALLLRREGAVWRAVRNVDPALSPRL